MSIWNNFTLTHIHHLGLPISNDLFMDYVIHFLFYLLFTLFSLCHWFQIEKNSIPYSLHYKFQYTLFKNSRLSKAALMAGHVTSCRCKATGRVVLRIVWMRFICACTYNFHSDKSYFYVRCHSTDFSTRLNQNFIQMKHFVEIIR